MYANYAQIKFIKIKRRSCFLNGAGYGTLEDSNRLKTDDEYTDGVSDQRTLLLIVPFKCRSHNLVLLGKWLRSCCLGRGICLIYLFEITLRLSLLPFFTLRCNCLCFLLYICCLIVALSSDHSLGSR